MDLAVLSAELKSSLLDLSEVFDSADLSYDELIGVAIADHHKVSPRRLPGTLALVAGTSLYDAPANIVSFGSSSWGMSARRTYKPWDSQYPQCLPTVSLVGEPSAQQLQLSVAPSATDITALGAAYSYTYLASYADLVQVRDQDAQTLLLRARAQAYLMMDARAAHRAATPSKPGAGNGRNYLGNYEALMRAWRACS